MSLPPPSVLPTPRRLPRVVKAVRTRANLVPVVIQQRALHATAKYIELARLKFNRNFPMPEVAFDLRGKTAGQAFLNKNLVRYNAVLLEENIADFESDTIPHEVAHLIAHQVYGPEIAGHGEEWKRVMRAFGVDPSRCHNYDVTNSAVGGIHEYTCNCGKKFPLSSRRSKSASAGRLICKTCKSKLRPVGSPAPAPTPARLPVRPAGLPVPPPHPGPARPPIPPPARTTVPVARPGPTVSTPWPPAAVVARPATPAMLQFALTLAHKLGIALQPEHTASFDACADFINRYKTSNGALSGALTARAPSEKQLQFARDLARRKGLLLGADVLSDAARMSAWLTANR